MITYIFRKRTPHAFSIEKLFDSLYAHMQSSGLMLSRLELPYVSTGFGRVMQNIWFVARRRKSKILHITGDVHYATLLCLFSRTIITVHDCVVLQRGTGFKRFVMRMLWFSLPMRLAHAVVCISDETKRELAKHMTLPERKMTVVSNFVDPAFEFSVRAFSVHMPRVLHVGVTANKNTPRVIAALRGLPCVLVIVGPLAGPLQDDIARNAVHVENYIDVDNATMARLYRDADIISFPSTYEGFGMPILEGQAVGRPVLTSDLEPMRSVAGPGGALFVDPLSVESIRDGFLRLSNEPVLRAKLIAAGKENVSRFTFSAVAARYARIYETVGRGGAVGTG